MELGESEFVARQLARRSAWWIHGVVLLLWTTLYLILFLDSLGAPGFEGLGASVAGVMLLCYAALTTLIVALFGRRPLVPLVLHGLALAGFVTWLVIATSGADARARSNEPERCLRVRGVHVIEGTPLMASVRLANACDTSVTVAQVTVEGEAPDGVVLLKESTYERSMVPNQSITVDVTADPRGATHTGGWNWSVFVELSAPRTATCYATPGSQRRDRCEMMGAVELALQ